LNNYIIVEYIYIKWDINHLKRIDMWCAQKKTYDNKLITIIDIIIFRIGDDSVTWIHIHWMGRVSVFFNGFEGQAEVLD